MAEKADFKSTGSNDSPPFENTAQRIVDDKGMRMGEAADLYGDLATAEEYGYVSRGYVYRPFSIRTHSDRLSQA